MIDTDKYEGHTPAEKWGEVVHGSNPRWREKKEWPLSLVAINMSDDYEPLYATLTDQMLMADAPLLLAEVKRLNHELIDAIDNMNWLDDLAARKEEEVKRLRGLLNMIVDKALHEVNTQPNGDDSPYNTILNIAYEGVIDNVDISN